MKKVSLIVVFIALACFLLSCGTTKNVFDETLTEEKAVTIKIDPSIKMKSYNGIDIKLKEPFLGMGYIGYTIPVGNASFVADLEIVASTNALTGQKHIIRARDFEFSFKFEPGKDYLIRCWYTDEDGKVAVSNVGRGLRMSLIICEDGFYNAVYIKRLGS